MVARLIKKRGLFRAKKDKKDLLPASVRYNLVVDATNYIEWAEVSSIEVLNKGPSYTYETLAEARGIVLDGEGTELKLGILKHEFEDDVVITWWLDDEAPITMVFDYKELVKNWEKEKERDCGLCDWNRYLDSVRHGI